MIRESENASEKFQTFKKQLLPYGPPPDWADLSQSQQAEILAHQFAIVRWWQRVQTRFEKRIVR